MGNKLKSKIEKKSYKFFTDIGFECVEIKGIKRYFVTGYISTKDLDKANDIITEDGLKNMLAQLKSKKIKLDVEHEAVTDSPDTLPIGRILESHIDSKGLFIKAELNYASPKFPAIWLSVKNGFLDAFSIAFRPIKKAFKKIGDTTVRLLDSVELFNVALTGNPVNPNCNISAVFMKSLEAMDEIQNEEKEMVEELEKKTEEVQEDIQAEVEAEVPTKTEEPAEAEAKPEAEAKEEPKEESSNDNDGAELKAMIKTLEIKLAEQDKKHETEMKALKKAINTPELKALAEQAPKIEEKEDTRTILDLIK